MAAFTADLRSPVARRSKFQINYTFLVQAIEGCIEPIKFGNGQSATATVFVEETRYAAFGQTRPHCKAPLRADAFGSAKLERPAGGGGALQGRSAITDAPMVIYMCGEFLNSRLSGKLALLQIRGREIPFSRATAGI